MGWLKDEGGVPLGWGGGGGGNVGVHEERKRKIEECEPALWGSG